MKSIHFILILVLIIGSSYAQTPWNIGLNSVDGATSADIGTTNNKPLNFFSNNTKNMILNTDGKLNIKSLAGSGIHLVFADSLGNLFRIGSGNPGIPRPGDPCLGSVGPWYEGGNVVNPNSNNTAGTCNNYDFILKANNMQSVYIKPAGKVGIGAIAPSAKFEVLETNPVGPIDGNNQLLTTIGTYVSSAYFKSSIWVVRDNNVISGAKVHDGLSTATTYGTPGLDTKTWWERTPGNDVQTWGTDANKYMSLDLGRLILGDIPASPNNALLNVNASSGIAFNVFDNTNNKVNFKINANGQTIIGNQPNAFNTALLNLNVAGGTTPLNVIDIYDETWVKAQFRVKSNGYVYCREVNVMPSNITFPDYVFDKNYDLRSINDVEKYIQQNKHLPNIPSASIVNKEGINLADMQVKQMEKIEEAFLYIIQLKKENDKLKARLELLEKK
jgi:hypothetical protein